MQLKDRIKQTLKKGYVGEPAWKAFIYWWLAANGYDYESPRPTVTTLSSNCTAFALMMSNPSSRGIPEFSYISKSTAAHNLRKVPREMDFFQPAV